MSMNDLMRLERLKEKNNVQLHTIGEAGICELNSY